MANNPEEDEYLDEDERDDIAQRSIFSAGWFRALLVLTVLAIVVVVSLPYLLNWLEPTPVAPPRPQTKASEPAPAPVAPAPATPAQTAGTAQPAKPETTAPPATAQTEAPKPAPAAPTPADRPLGTAPLPAAPAQAPPAAKAAPAKPEAVKPPAVAAAPKRALTPAPAAGGSYWIQVGAFAQEKNAEALAKTLRAEQFPVEIARLSRGGGGASAPAKTVESGGQNQLVITGSTPDAVNAALKGKGTAQVVKGGIVVNPAYDLETAMSLSSQLKKEGFKVVIRRAKSGATTAAPATGDGITYHVVRVGGFADRAKAQQARADLRAKGHAGFVTQGAPR